MEIIKLIGVLVVIVGLTLRLDTLATVVVAGVLTGFVAGMSPLEILTVLGNAFIGNRVATLFVLALPAIGICERYGLKDKAVDLIKKIKNATTGRILSLYLVIRVFAAATSLRIGGHIQFIRPLINPMARGAAVAKYGEIDEKTEDDIKGLSAAVRTSETSSVKTASLELREHCLSFPHLQSREYRWMCLEWQHGPFPLR